ncbi:hypothetical protein A33M_3123 [Rhodovulum sp. PH10]|uniref:hypothetical protein n=1 Tax=Rhodovulum sp. PH10 TaxID=1187851 RepID=UPI00027C2048|nr:hypothetical protein [Rhodovulum sp. PH10]EJW11510.1 hypothetical protein A33M_3123 [Rhodovulum sp. PH10]
MSCLTIDSDRAGESAETVFETTARFYASVWDAQIAQTKRILDFYHHWLTLWGGHHRPEEYHTSELDSALADPDAKAKAWAVRYTAGGLAPAD